MNPNANVFIPKCVSLSLKKQLKDKHFNKNENEINSSNLLNTMKQKNKQILKSSNIISPTPRLQSKLPEWFIRLEY